MQQAPVEKAQVAECRAQERRRCIRPVEGAQAVEVRRKPLRRNLPVRPAHPLLTRLLGPNLTSLPRQILTATASLRSSRLQQAPVEKAQVAGCRA